MQGPRQVSGDKPCQPLHDLLEINSRDGCLTGNTGEIDITKARRLTEIRLRIMATSDLHMQITAFDYVKDRPNMGGSLAKLATLIQEARAEAAAQDRACLLFDNGDTFQGTPLSDLLARMKDDTAHPMVASMRYLGFDAGGLGNHDFDHGLDRLSCYLRQHDMPIVCSNMTAAALPMVQESLILPRNVTCSQGIQHAIRIGVLGSLPDKTALWSRHHVEERANFKQPLAVMDAQARKLRASGADLVVVLAHMGLALFDEGAAPQNQVVDVAALRDVDVVIGGHTHLRFPGPEHCAVPGADCIAGTVHGKPVVQPGASAADLGIIDLTLARDSTTHGWHVVSRHVELRAAGPDTPEDAQILALTKPMHDKTRRHLSQPVAKLSQHLNSFFALAHPSPVPALLAAAKRRLIEQSIVGTPDADLPLLAVASTPLTGGFDGPDNFLHLPPGDLKRQHVAGMNPYANHVWAVRTTGAQLRDWLERSALIFNTLRAQRPDQMLIDHQVPGFRYDAIYGLTYQIDPRNRPCFDTTGRRIVGRVPRISNIQWQGRPLQDDQVFLVATTDHRAGGGGLYKTFQSADIVLQGHAPLQDAVLEYLKDPDCDAIRAAKPWSFVPAMNRSAILLTAPEATGYFDDIAHLAPEPCGETPEGFLRLRLHL